MRKLHNAGMKGISPNKFLSTTGVIVLAVAGTVFFVANNNKPATAPVVTSEQVSTPEPQHTEQPPVPPPQVTPPSVPPGSKNSPQFVVLAFDGSYSLKKWNDTLSFAREMKANKTPIHFTYFLSGVYFLADQYKSEYQPPLKPAGTSLIGFGYNQADIKARVAYVNQALAEGHEIGSHANGHFNGSTWTAANWQQEFTQFNKLIFSIPENNRVETDPQDYQIHMDLSEMVGFRSPNLGSNNELWPVLKANGYLYDTSLVGKATAWPKQLENGLWEFPLANIKFADQNSTILSMDYNFYYKQSKAVDVAKKGDETWKKFYNQTFTSYMNYFNGNYNGEHAPVYIGSHFSDWNDGVYWEAMKDFAKEVCGKPQVQCVSFRELMNYLETSKLDKPQQQ